MESKQQSKFTGQLDDIKGKPYMRAHSAIAWFREDWPVSEASILTTCIQTEPIVWQAEIWIGDRVAARAHATQTNVNKDHGKLETNAVRRALALCGYGTETALGDDDFDAETGDSLNKNRPSATNGARPAASQGNGSNAASAPTQTQQPRNITPLTTATLGNTHGPIKGDEKPTPKVAADDDLANKEVATAFIEGTRKAGIADSEVLAALGVGKLSEWTAGRKAAGQRVKEWQAGKLADNDETTSHDQQKTYEAVSYLYEVRNKDGVVNPAGTWKHVVNAYNKLAREGVIRTAMSTDQVIAALVAYKQGAAEEDLKQFAQV